MDENKNNNFSLTWLPKKTFEILATVPWSEIEKAKKQAVVKAGESMEIKGFRKGKAPENLIVEALSPNKLLELTLQEIIPEFFSKAISNFGLKPIISPKIELVSSEAEKLVSAKEKEDWKIKFTSCEEPEVKLGNYKDELKKQKAADSIWTPEKGGSGDKKEQSPENSAKKKDEKLDKTIKYLLDNIKVEIGDLLIDSEVGRKLSELLEQTQRLGLTIDQYLSSIGKTVEALRREYKSQVERTLALQLILGAIAEAEKIAVTPEEIEKAILSTKNEEERKALESQKYVLASILRQQKTLDFLASL